jgi:hypothetical protein
MRIAYCIAGQPRYHDGYCYQTVFEQLLSKYDIDVFFHTWWSEEEVGDKQYRSPWSGTDDFDLPCDCPSKLIKQYRPKRFKIESSRFFEEDANLLQTDNKQFWSNSGLPYAYSVQQVSRLKREYEEELGIRYDLVILTRFDLLIGTIMDLTTVDPSVFTVASISRIPDMCSDALTILNSENFDRVYSTLFDNIGTYIAEGVNPMNEHILYHQACVVNGIPLHRSRKMFVQIARELFKPGWIDKKVWLNCPNEFDP